MDQERRIQRIKSIAAQIVTGMIEKGKIECTDEAIRGAMPGAIATAKAAYDAVEEFLFDRPSVCRERLHQRAPEERQRPASPRLHFHRYGELTCP